MTEAYSHGLTLMPKPVIGLAIIPSAILSAGGPLCYGVTVGGLERFWPQSVNWPTGLMSFRLLLQPSMAANRDGVEDARVGRSPYFLTVVRSLRERADRPHEVLTAAAKIIRLGIPMVAIDQFRVFKTLDPDEAFIVSLLLSFVFYLLIRGPATCCALAARWYVGRDLATVSRYICSTLDRVSRGSVLREGSA
jgi:hypothetical protein